MPGDNCIIDFFLSIGVVFYHRYNNVDPVLYVHLFLRRSVFMVNILRSMVHLYCNQKMGVCDP